MWKEVQHKIYIKSMYNIEWNKTLKSQTPLTVPKNVNMFTTKQMSRAGM